MSTTQIMKDGFLSLLLLYVLVNELPVSDQRVLADLHYLNQIKFNNLKVIDRLNVWSTKKVNFSGISTLKLSRD